jgi:hypothetical protein
MTSDLNDHIKTNKFLGLRFLIFFFEIMLILLPGIYLLNLNGFAPNMKNKFFELSFA